MWWRFTCEIRYPTNIRRMMYSKKYLLAASIEVAPLLSDDGDDILDDRKDISNSLE